MRPELLFPLFQTPRNLKGVGGNTQAALKRLCLKTGKSELYIRDLLFHVPVGLIDRRHSPSLATAKEGDIITLVVTIERYEFPERGSHRPHKVLCYTPEGYLHLVFFKAAKAYIEKMFPLGEKRAVSGKLERYGVTPQINHPGRIAPAESLDTLMTIEVVYPLTYGITNSTLARIIQSALTYLPDLPEWIDEHLLKKNHWQSFKTSLHALHSPKDESEIAPENPNRQRLAYDELLANQLALALIRQHAKKKSSQIIITHEQKLRQQLREVLPYQLTHGQEKVIAEIDADMRSGQKMLRLLQGDVGSGKTIVALMSMLSVIEAGGQAALMVPTEILTRQHEAFIRKVTAPLGVRVALLLGGMKEKEHKALITEIAAGNYDIIIGTHALFQEKVSYKTLNLVVIDEQHRFGVEQRLSLSRKAKDTHVLVMTATPIPRTLAMTAFGDMDSSILAEKPIGRQAIKTIAKPLSREEEVLEAVGRALQKGDKLYWICPLVEESEEEPSDITAAESRYTEFKARFGNKVGLAHGKMKAEERNRVMQAFKDGEYHLLVATTVVEVGVDIPDATIMIIEHAERFGLSQLHQLRGRVGRSDKASLCILLYQDNIGEIGKKRLAVMRESNDGFFIAEEDLKLRGSGEVLGTRQSGIKDFHFADMQVHAELMHIAHQDVKLVLHKDPELDSARGKALRCLLYLFGYDETIRYVGG